MSAADSCSTILPQKEEAEMFHQQFNQAFFAVAWNLNKFFCKFPIT